MASNDSTQIDNEENQRRVEADVEQFNKQFYGSFDTHYFMQKGLYLVALIARPEVIHDVLQEGVAFKSLQLKLNEQEAQELESTKLVKNLKAEVAVTYAHAIETLFRLLFAHAAASDCPWLELSTNTSFKKFKADVMRFTKREYFHKVSHEEGLAIIFFGNDSKPKQVTQTKWRENLKKLSEFLDYYASDLLASYAYNSYKHGLAIFNEEFGFNLADVIKVDKSDAMLFLTHEKDEKPGHRKLYREYVFTKWESKFALMYQLTSILDNMMTVGRVKFTGTSEYKLSMFDEFDLGALIKTKGSDIVMNSVKESSFSFRDKNQSN